MQRKWPTPEEQEILSGVEMAAFDRLPRSVQQALTKSLIGLPSLQVEAYFLANGEETTLRWITAIGLVLQKKKAEAIAEATARLKDSARFGNQITKDGRRVDPATIKIAKG